MYHLNSGSGPVSDSSGTLRNIQATAMIFDQLATSTGNPVKVTPGQPFIDSPNYIYQISDWHIAVDRLGAFFGQS